MAIVFSLVTVSAETVPGGGLLERTGKRVEQFWDQFSSVTCTEVVSQTKLGPNGKMIQQKRSVFDYLIVMQWIGEELNVDESRLVQEDPKSRSKLSSDTNPALLTTNGFATLLLIFHPRFQSSYQFTQLADEELGVRRLHRIRFEHVRGAPSASVLQLRRRDYPLEWQGVAWIDPQSHSIVKINAGLKASIGDVGLRELSSEVTYLPVRFTGSPEEQWLPSVARIEARTARQHWRNVHQFSSYRQFNVQTDVKMGEVKQ